MQKPSDRVIEAFKITKDSDKINLHPRWKAKPENMARAWTRAQDGLVDSYWDREE